MTDYASFYNQRSTKHGDGIIRANIFECLALSKNRPTSDASDYIKKWGKTQIHFSELEHFEAQFGKFITIWRIITDREHSHGTLILGSGMETNALNVSLGSSWDEDSEVISIDDETCFIKNEGILIFFPCKYDNCSQICKSVAKLDEHHAAHIKQRITCQQEILGKNAFIWDEMIEQAILPKGFRQTNFLTWDIESLIVPSDIGLRHTPVTISCCKNFGEEREWFCARSDMSPEALSKMMKKFVDYVEKSAIEYQKLLPPEISDNIRAFYIQLKLSFPYVLSVLAHFLKKICFLTCYLFQLFFDLNL